MSEILEPFKNLSSKQKDIFALLSFAILTLVIYWKTIFFQYSIDDQYYLWLYIEEGSSFFEYFKSLQQRFWAQEYRPVTFISILLEALVFGKNPSVHHVFNLLYYILLCFLIYKFLLKLFSVYEYKSITGICILITVIFLVHPSHANVVSSIKNRETILSLLFGISAFYFWLKFVDHNDKKYLIFSVILLLIGIYAKRDVITFMIIMPVIGWLTREKLNYKYILISLIGIVVTISLGIWVIDNFIAEQSTAVFVMNGYENILVEQDITLIKRFPFVVDKLLRYEVFMVWPFDYYFYFGYDVIPIVSNYTPRIIFILLCHFAFLALMIFCYKKEYKKFIIGPIIFFFAIAPFVVGLVTGYIAVRYSFIASLGFSILLGQILFIGASDLRRHISVSTYVLCAMLMLLFGFKSYERSLAWESIDKLYSTDIPKIKQSANANRMACMYYHIIAEEESDEKVKLELYEKSQQYCDQALSIYKIPKALEYKASGLINLNRAEEAFSSYKQLLEIDSSHEDALSYLAYMNKEKNYNNAAIDYFEKLIKVNKNRKDAYIELTQLYNFTGEYEKAIAINKTFFHIGYAYDALLNFGDTFIAKGDTLSGLINYMKAIEIKNEDFILEEVSRIAVDFGNDSILLELNNILE